VVELNGYARIVALSLDLLLKIDGGAAFKLNEGKDVLLLHNEATLRPTAAFLATLYKHNIRHRTYRVGGWWFVDILDSHLRSVASFALTGAAFTPDIEAAHCIVYRGTAFAQVLFDYHAIQDSAVPARPQVVLEMLRALLVLQLQESADFPTGAHGVHNGRLESKQARTLPRYTKGTSIAKRIERWGVALALNGVDLTRKPVLCNDGRITLL